MSNLGTIWEIQSHGYVITNKLKQPFVHLVVVMFHCFQNSWVIEPRMNHSRDRVSSMPAIWLAVRKSSSVVVPSLVMRRLFIAIISIIISSVRRTRSCSLALWLSAPAATSYIG